LTFTENTNSAKVADQVCHPAFTSTNSVGALLVSGF